MFSMLCVTIVERAAPGALRDRGEDRVRARSRHLSSCRRFARELREHNSRASDAATPAEPRRHPRRGRPTIRPRRRARDAQTYDRRDITCPMARSRSERYLAREPLPSEEAHSGWTRFSRTTATASLPPIPPSPRHSRTPSLPPADALVARPRVSSLRRAATAATFVYFLLSLVHSGSAIFFSLT
jgi:hypothetical protein